MLARSLLMTWAALCMMTLLAFYLSTDVCRLRFEVHSVEPLSLLVTEQNQRCGDDDAIALLIADELSQRAKDNQPLTKGSFPLVKTVGKKMDAATASTRLAAAGLVLAGTYVIMSRTVCTGVLNDPSPITWPLLFASLQLQLFFFLFSQSRTLRWLCEAGSLMLHSSNKFMNCRVLCGIILWFSLTEVDLSFVDMFGVSLESLGATYRSCVLLVGCAASLLVPLLTSWLDQPAYRLKHALKCRNRHCQANPHTLCAVRAGLSAREVGDLARILQPEHKKQKVNYLLYAVSHGNSGEFLGDLLQLLAQEHFDLILSLLSRFATDATFPTYVETLHSRGVLATPGDLKMIEIILTQKQWPHSHQWLFEKLMATDHKQARGFAEKLLERKLAPPGVEEVAVQMLQNGTFHVNPIDPDDANVNATLPERIRTPTRQLLAFLLRWYDHTLPFHFKLRFTRTASTPVPVLMKLARAQSIGAFPPLDELKGPLERYLYLLHWMPTIEQPIDNPRVCQLLAEAQATPVDSAEYAAMVRETWYMWSCGERHRPLYENAMSQFGSAEAVFLLALMYAHEGKFDRLSELIASNPDNCKLQVLHGALTRCTRGRSVDQLLCAMLPGEADRTSAAFDGHWKERLTGQPYVDLLVDLWLAAHSLDPLLSPKSDSRHLYACMHELLSPKGETKHLYERMHELEPFVSRRPSVLTKLILLDLHPGDEKRQREVRRALRFLSATCLKPVVGSCPTGEIDCCLVVG